MTLENTQDYKLTFLQKLLGRNYKWWYILYHSMIRETGGKIGFVSGYFATVLRIVSSNYIWYLAQSDSSTFTYLLIGDIYSSLTSNVYYYRLSDSIYTGKLSSQLLLPIGFFKSQISSAFGTRITKNLFSIIATLIGVLICSLTFARIDLPSLTILLVLLTIPLTFIIQQFLGTIVGSIAFWIKEEYDYEGVRRSYESVFFLLSGALIPLYKLPFNLINYLNFLPTSWILHHPMQIYLGKYTPIETLYVFLGGIAWCVILYFLAKWVFKMGLKKNEAVGL